MYVLGLLQLKRYEPYKMGISLLKSSHICSASVSLLLGMLSIKRECNNNNNNYGIYIAPYTLAALWRFTILQLKIL